MVRVGALLRHTSSEASLEAWPIAYPQGQGMTEMYLVFFTRGVAHCTSPRHDRSVSSIVYACTLL